MMPYLSVRGLHGFHFHVQVGEYAAQVVASVGVFHVCKVFGAAFGYDLPALVARARPEVNQPVRALYQVEMVLDKNDAVSGVHEAVEHPHQVCAVLEREPRRRLVQYI